MHKSGFVNIVGRPNVGKSTLMNALVGERMSVITSKPQTTRHRILGIISEDDYQIVFSDSPGMIDDPAYKMQAAMNQFAYSSFEDADIVLFVTDPEEKLKLHPRLEEKLRNTQVAKIWVLNKIDLLQNDEANTLVESCRNLDLFDEYFLISALQNIGIEPLFQKIIELLPEGPEYYPKDQLTDKPERFFVSEMIRGKILELYYQEIPYSVEVVIEEFKEEDLNGKELVRIYAVIFVSRQSQKGIIIGKGGSAIKQLGIESRKQIEEFLGKQIFLELYVKVKENWRDKEYYLKQFGYQ